MAESKAHQRFVAAATETALPDYLYGLTHTGSDTERWMGPYADVSGADLWARYTKSGSGRWQLSGVVLLGDAITSAQLRRVPVAALENSWNLSSDEASAEVEKIRDLPPLVRTDGMTPADFSKLVAEHYRRWAGQVPHPVPAMAAQCGASRATVHSWVREARLRGFLPPGRERKS